MVIDSRSKYMVLGGWIVAIVFTLLFAVILFLRSRELAPWILLERVGTQLAQTLDSKATGKSVAVVPFRSRDGAINALGTVTAHEISVAVAHRAANFNLIDRYHLEELWNELNRSRSDIVDSSVESDQLKAVNVLVTGSIYETSRRYYLRISAIDVQTSTLIAAYSVQLPSSKALLSLYEYTIESAESQEVSATGSMPFVVDKTADFVSTNWTWLWTILLVPAYGVILFRLLRKRPADKTAKKAIEATPPQVAKPKKSSPEAGETK